MTMFDSPEPPASTQIEPYRVLVLWADDESANLGVRVLAQGVMELYSKVFRDSRVEFTLHDFGPGVDVEFGMRSVLRDIVTGGRAYSQFIGGFDAVIDTGAGDSFSDIYGIKRLAVMVYCQRIAFKLGIPLFLAPQTIGPFRSRSGRALARHTLKRATSIVVRDSVSADVARRLSGHVDAIATDVVFSLPKPSVDKVRDVVVNVSGLLWVDNGHVRSEYYRAAIRSLIAGLIAQQRSVTLMAHVLNNETRDSDEGAVRALRDEFHGQVEVSIPRDLTEARSVIASSMALVGSRMHACLNALSAGVPCVAWAYSRKFAPLFDDLGWASVLDLRTDPYCVDKTLSLLSDWKAAAPLVNPEQIASRATSRLESVVSILRAGDK